MYCWEKHLTNHFLIDNFELNIWGLPNPINIFCWKNNHFWIFFLYLQPPGPWCFFTVFCGDVKGFYWRLWSCFLLIHIRPYLSPPLTPIRNHIYTVNLGVNTSLWKDSRLLLHFCILLRLQLRTPRWLLLAKFCYR